MAGPLSKKALPTDVRCLTSGKVTSVDGKPLAGAKIEVWQCNSAGFIVNKRNMMVQISI